MEWPSGLWSGTYQAVICVIAIPPPMGRYRSNPGFLGDPPVVVVGLRYGTNPIDLPPNLGCSPLLICSGKRIN